jgi:hypothetical protein
MLPLAYRNLAIAVYQLVVQWSDAAAEQQHWSSQHFMKLAPAMTALCETTNVITSTPLVPEQTQPQPKVQCSLRNIASQDNTFLFTVTCCIAVLHVCGSQTKTAMLILLMLLVLLPFVCCLLLLPYVAAAWTCNNRPDRAKH